MVFLLLLTINYLTFGQTEQKFQIIYPGILFNPNSVPGTVNGNRKA